MPSNSRGTRTKKSYFPRYVNISTQNSNIKTRFSGTQNLEQTCIALSSAGNFFGTPYNGLLVGGRSSAIGEHFVLAGNKTIGTNGQLNAISLTGQNGRRLRYPPGISSGTVVTAIDANKDNKTDIVSGAGGYSGLSGVICVAYGGKGTGDDGTPISFLSLNGTNGYCIYTTESGSLSGQSMKGVDFFGTGYRGLATGSLFAAPYGKINAGSLFFLESDPENGVDGKLTITNSTKVLRRDGEAGWQFTQNIGVADLTMDGREEIIAGAPRATSPAGVINAGSVYIFVGHPGPDNSIFNVTQMPSQQLITLHSNSTGALCGYSFPKRTAYFNDDIYPDLAIGCAGGIVHIAWGPFSPGEVRYLTDQYNVSTIYGRPGASSFIVEACDRHGTGIDTLSISSVSATTKDASGNNLPNAGMVDVLDAEKLYHKKTMYLADENENITETTYMGGNANGQAGYSEACVDLNGNGREEHVIGEPNAGPGHCHIFLDDVSPDLEQLKPLSVPHKGKGHLNTSHVNITDDQGPETFNITLHVKNGYGCIEPACDVPTYTDPDKNSSTIYFPFAPLAAGNKVGVVPAGPEEPEVWLGVNTTGLAYLPPQRLNVTFIRTQAPQIPENRVRLYQDQAPGIFNLDNLDATSVYPTQAKASMRYAMDCPDIQFDSTVANQTAATNTFGVLATNTITAVQTSQGDTPPIPSSCTATVWQQKDAYSEEIGLSTSGTTTIEYFGRKNNAIAGLVGSTGTPVCVRLKRAYLDVHDTIPGSNRAYAIWNLPPGQNVKVTTDDNLQQGVAIVTQQNVDDETHCVVSTNNAPPILDASLTIPDDGVPGGTTIPSRPIRFPGFIYSPAVGPHAQAATQGLVTRMTTAFCTDPGNTTATDDIGVAFLDDATHNRIYHSNDPNLTSPIPSGPQQGYNGPNVVRQYEFTHNGGLYHKTDPTGLRPTRKAQCVFPNNVTSDPFDLDYSGFQTVNPPARVFTSGILSTRARTPVSLAGALTLDNQDVLVTDVGDIDIITCPDEPPQNSVVQKIFADAPKPSLSTWKYRNVQVTSIDPVQLLPVSGSNRIPKEPVTLCVQAITKFGAISEKAYIRADLGPKPPPSFINNQLKGLLRNGTRLVTEDHFLATSEVADSAAINWGLACNNLEFYTKASGKMVAIDSNRIAFDGKNISDQYIYVRRGDNNDAYGCVATISNPATIGGLSAAPQQTQVDLIPGYVPARFTMASNKLNLYRGVNRQPLVRSNKPLDQRCQDEIGCIDGDDVGNGPLARRFAEMDIVVPTSRGCHIENTQYKGRILTRFPASGIGAYLDIVVDNDECYIELKLDNGYGRGTANDTLLSDIFALEGNFVSAPSSGPQIPAPDNTLTYLGFAATGVSILIGIGMRYCAYKKNKELVEFQRKIAEEGSYAARLRNMILDRLFKSTTPTRSVSKCGTSDEGKFEKLKRAVMGLVTVLIEAEIICEKTSDAELISIADKMTMAILSLPVFVNQGPGNLCWSYFGCRRQYHEKDLGHIEVSKTTNCCTKLLNCVCNVCRSSANRVEFTGKDCCTKLMSCNCSACSCLGCGPVEYTVEDLAKISPEITVKLKAEANRPIGEINEETISNKKQLKALKIKEAIMRKIQELLGETFVARLQQQTAQFKAETERLGRIERELKRLRQENYAMTKVIEGNPESQHAYRIAMTEAAADEAEYRSSSNLRLRTVAAANSGADASLEDIKTGINLSSVHVDTGLTALSPSPTTPATPDSTRPLLNSTRAQQALHSASTTRGVGASARSQLELAPVNTLSGVATPSNDENPPPPPPEEAANQPAKPVHPSAGRKKVQK